MVACTSSCVNSRPSASEQWRSASSSPAPRRTCSRSGRHTWHRHRTATAVSNQAGRDRRGGPVSAGGCRSSSGCWRSTSRRGRGRWRGSRGCGCRTRRTSWSRCGRGTSPRSRRKGRRSRGRSATPDSYDGSEPTTRFETEIPTFADTDALSRLLEREGVVENARPLDNGGSLGARLLVGFGPTLLLVGLLFWLARRAGNVQKRARVVRPLFRPPLPTVRRSSDVRRRRRNRRSEAGADRGRRLPAQPRQVRPARGTHPARRAAVRATRHRQDAPRPGARRGGQRAVLLDVRLGVRRGNRRRRRRPRPRPVQAGQGGTIGDHLHRRARRRRPLPDLRRGRVQRWKRRARTDPQPDPDRDGRVRLLDQGDRRRRDQPARSARSGPAPARPVRPPRHGAATGPQRPSAHPRRTHTWGAARSRRGPRRSGRFDAGNGRRRSGQPRQRGHVARHRVATTPRSPTPTSPTPSRRLSSARNARCS